MDSLTDTTKHALFRKIEPFQSEAALLVQIFPWETEFMNNALWSPRGARAGERTHTAGYTASDLEVVSLKTDVGQLCRGGYFLLPNRE